MLGPLMPRVMQDKQSVLQAAASAGMLGIFDSMQANPYDEHENTSKSNQIMAWFPDGTSEFLLTFMSEFHHT